MPIRSADYGGGGIDARIGPNPAVWTLSGPPGRQWGKTYKDHLRTFPRTMLAQGHTTSLPVEANGVSLDPVLKDAWGMPAMRCTYKDHPDDLKFAVWLQDRAAEILAAAGALEIWRVGVAESTMGVHLLGTCRMGNDPQHSVVDRFHRTHDVPNLFLCDGSSFVTSGRGQPTMTIQALAFRRRRTSRALRAGTRSESSIKRTFLRGHASRTARRDDAKCGILDE